MPNITKKKLKEIILNLPDLSVWEVCGRTEQDKTLCYHGNKVNGFADRNKLIKLYKNHYMPDEEGFNKAKQSRKSGWYTKYDYYLQNKIALTNEEIEGLDISRMGAILEKLIDEICQHLCICNKDLRVTTHTLRSSDLIVIQRGK